LFHVRKRLHTPLVVADFLSHTSTGIVSSTAQSPASSRGDHDGDVGSETSTTGQNPPVTVMLPLSGKIPSIGP